MLRFGANAMLVIAIVTLLGCDGEESPEPIVHVAPQPADTVTEPAVKSESSGGLPADWFIVSNDGTGLMLENMDDEDAWIWVCLEAEISGGDVGQGPKIHRKAVTDSPAGTYFDNGSVETSAHGTGTWSWGSFEGDGEEEGKNELVLFVPLTQRGRVLSLRYLYPLEGGAGFDDRLVELVAVADSLNEGS